MKTFLFEIERFLRFIVRLDDDGLAQHATEIREGAEALAETIETEIDRLENDSLRDN